MNKYCGTSKSCGNVCRRGITDQSVKDTIVKAHNDVRRKLAKGLEKRGHNMGGDPQPKAADMLEMSWDDQLAEVAQRWADQCVWAHDKKRDTPKFNDGAGQNMYMEGLFKADEKLDFQNFVVQWYDEVRCFNGKKPWNEQDGAPCVVGHYTQMAWAKSIKVGCGMTVFDKKKDGKNIEMHFVCNYGPAGNDVGINICPTFPNCPINQMYTVGETASKCPNGDNDGLCKPKA